MISCPGFYQKRMMEASLACNSVGISIPFQGAGITDVQTWPQLKACLLGRILETDSFYTDASMMIIYFCLKRSQKTSWIHPSADHSVKAEEKAVIRFIELDETIAPLD